MTIGGTCPGGRPGLVFSPPASAAVTAAFLALLLAAPPLSAQGWYAGGELGLSRQSDIDVDESDTDVPSSFCDRILFSSVPPSVDCDRPEPPWSSENDLDGGLLSGAQLGYYLGDFRLELEYFYRYNSSHSQGRNEISFASEKTSEILENSHNIDQLRGHHFFLNAYYDFAPGGRWKPYAGFGVGAAKLRYDLSTRFVRNGDPAAFPAAAYTPDQADALAGLITSFEGEIEDTLFGYQLIGGVDYALSRRLSLGAKLRWARFEGAEDRRPWDLLRSHESANTPGGERVVFTHETGDIEFFSASLNAKYHWGGPNAALPPPDKSLERGWYWGAEWGVVRGYDKEARETIADLPTNCDPVLLAIARRTGRDPAAAPGPHCAQAPSSTPSNISDLDAGHQAGVQLGFAWGNGWRGELEYAYRAHASDDRTPNRLGGATLNDKEGEFEYTRGGVSDLRSHSVFGNVYYDFSGPGEGVHWYVGAGLGASYQRADILSLWVRQVEPGYFTNLPAGERGTRLPEAAGTVSLWDEEAADTVPSAQLLAGVDYALSSGSRLGLKLRWTRARGLRDDIPGDYLRSHFNPLVARVKTDDEDFWGLSVNFKTAL